jgi:hypothetical protein
MKKRRRYNNNRRMRTNIEDGVLDALVDKVNYGGNPEHKRNPGDFGLTPPVTPRSDKSLCDEVNIVKRAEALTLLKCGIKKGLISQQERNGFPQNIWAVTGNGSALEAQLENSQQGTYHGYPMPKDDPFRNEVLRKWSESER